LIDEKTADINRTIVSISHSEYTLKLFVKCFMLRVHLVFCCKTQTWLALTHIYQ